MIDVRRLEILKTNFKQNKRNRNNVNVSEVYFLKSVCILFLFLFFFFLSGIIWATPEVAAWKSRTGKSPAFNQLQKWKS